MAELTHFDAKGDAHMVDVGAKAQTKRIARARGEIHMAPATFALCAAGTAKKGDVIGVARIAAIMASKRTSELIPLCHPIALTHVSVDLSLMKRRARWYALLSANAQVRPALKWRRLQPCRWGC